MPPIAASIIDVIRGSANWAAACSVRAQWLIWASVSWGVASNCGAPSMAPCASNSWIAISMSPALSVGLFCSRCRFACAWKRPFLSSCTTPALVYGMIRIRSGRLRSTTSRWSATSMNRSVCVTALGASVPIFTPSVSRLCKVSSGAPGT